MRDLRSAAGEVEKAILAVESRLFNLTATGRGRDFLRTPSQALEKLLHLADVVSYADFAPTDSLVEVAAKLTQDIAHDREQLDGVLARTLAGFNTKLAARQKGPSSLRRIEFSGAGGTKTINLRNRTHLSLFVSGQVR